MYFTLFNNGNETSTDAKKTAPSSCVAKNDGIINIIIAGIVVAVPAISIINVDLSITIGIIGLLLAKLIIMHVNCSVALEKVKRKTLVQQ